MIWAVLLLLVYALTPLFSKLELYAYDAGVRLTSHQADPRIAIIAIDQASIDHLGPLPWSRDLYARLIAQLAAAGAKVIATDVLFTGPQQDRGLIYIEQLQRLYQEDHSDSINRAAIGSVLSEALKKLNVDQQLAGSMASAGNVILPVLFETGGQRDKPDTLLPGVQKWQLALRAHPEDWPPFNAASQPFAPLAAAAAGMGSENIQPDDDNVVRSMPLALHYAGKIYPSFTLVTAARSLNLKPDQIKLTAGESVLLGKVQLPVSSPALFRPYFYPAENGKPPFATESFFDVSSGKISASQFKGKIVLIGVTAAGAGAVFATPQSADDAPVMIAAHTLSALLQQHHYITPPWSRLFSALLALALLLTLLLPIRPAALLTVVLLVLAGHFILMTRFMIWLPLMGPAALLLTGSLLLAARRSVLKTHAGPAESAESDRMLGMAFQGQGQLDKAFEILTKVPLDDGMMGILYNLALDFERKHQFTQAEAVFQYMAGHNPHYRDLEAKLQRARQIASMPDGAVSGLNGSMLLEESSLEKPMLGCYQVEKELGKGAMGIVYLGKDHKTDREVAIKTLSLAEEFDAGELDDFRQRFFREAETARRLNHPHIVTIFDAGEEHDLCYIAMELLKGHDLLAYTEVNHLLPLTEVSSIVRQVAEALHYAHLQQVIHRDIKPANIMYDPDEKIVKVTDFGIARVIDSSKTRTGLVLGSPSYMSPEQLSGQKMDGRSDLFSLGVMLYQLCTGSLPFNADSIGGLMYKIANETPQDPRLLNPRLPAMLAAIIMKSLQKETGMRFQTGAHFAAAMTKLEAGLRSREARG